MAFPENLGEYTMNMYEDMVSDTARTEAYAHALREVVKDGDVVVDIGTGPFALLACQAAQAGAGRVFAIEVDSKAAESACQLLKNSSDEWASKIEVKQGVSTNVVLPIRADVVLHELIGLIAGCEGAAAILRDAFARHAKQLPGVMARTWTVPARARSWLVPVEIPTKKQLLVAGSTDGHRRVVFSEGELVTSISNFPFAACAIARPEYFEVLDFARLPSDPKVLETNLARRLKFAIERPGVFAGFAIFITGEMTPRAVASADAAEAKDPASCNFFSPDAPTPGIGFCSAWRDSHWSNLVVRLNLTNGDSMHVARGDIIEVESTVDLYPFHPIYTFRATLQQQHGEKVELTQVLDGMLEKKFGELARLVARSSC